MSTDDQVAQLSDLLQLLSEWLAMGDGTLQSVMSRWINVQRGAISQDDTVPLPVPPSAASLCRARIPPAPRRQAAAIEMCKAGPITSGMLAQTMGCGNETARTDLVALARGGTLEASGTRRTRCYRLAPCPATSEPRR
jgi:hypothetical protein